MSLPEIFVKSAIYSVPTLANAKRKGEGGGVGGEEEEEDRGAEGVGVMGQ